MPRPATGCEDYVRIRLGAWRLWMHRDFPALDDAVRDAGKPQDGVRGPFQRIPASDYARVFKGELSLLGRTHHYFLKQYLYRSGADFLKHLFRPSRGMRAFKATLLLARNGFAAPFVIALGEYRPWLFCRQCFVITSRVEHARPVYMWLSSQWPAGDPRACIRRRAFIRRLGGLVGRLHACGICHGDLRPGNVLAAEAGDDWTFWLLDNERTRAFKRLPGALRVKNLVQIGMLREDCVGRTDRMRFFRAYLHENPSLRGRYKHLAKEVFARTRGRLAGKTGDQPGK